MVYNDLARRHLMDAMESFKAEGNIDMYDAIQQLLYFHIDTESRALPPIYVWFRTGCSKNSQEMCDYMKAQAGWIELYSEYSAVDYGGAVDYRNASAFDEKAFYKLRRDIINQAKEKGINIARLVFDQNKKDEWGE